MADQAAVVWIDTNGQFYIQSCNTVETADVRARDTNESGLPAVIITRQEVIDGDFKSNAQLDAEADDD